MGHSSVRETAQSLFTFQYLISNNYSSGTISKAKYILHCKCKTFVSGFGHKPYLVHKRRKFSSYKILNWKYVSNILFIHLCGIGKYSQIAFLIKESDIWKLFQHWIVWCSKNYRPQDMFGTLWLEWGKFPTYRMLLFWLLYISTVDWLATDFIKQFIKYNDFTWWATTWQHNLKAHPN